MLEPFSKKTHLNLKKTIGLLHRIEKMVEEKRYCVDIAQQLNAAIGMLRQTNSIVLENHLNTCGGHKLSSKNKEEKDAFVKELIKSFTMSTK
jgi:DNA-binding FrmR family transcriptional regulator